MTTKDVHYETHGEGSQTFILLHNAGGNLSFFKPQITFLQTYGKVIAIDLLGHGKSKKPKQDYSVAEYAAAIDNLLNHLNINQAVGIGLNYGANIFIEMGSEHINSLIMIDPPLFMSDEIRNFVQHHIDDLISNKKDYAKDLVNHSFLKADRNSLEVALSAFESTPSSVLASVYTDLLVWDKTSFEKVQQIDIPTLCIMTDGSLCSMAELLKCNPKVKLGKVVESLYWATLEVPDQINAMIARFLSFNPK